MPELGTEARALRERLESEAATEDELRDVRLRVLERLEGPRPRRLGWALSFAGMAALALAVALWPSTPPDWFAPTTGAGCLASEAGAVSSDACTEPAVITVQQDRVTLDPRTRLERQPDALRLTRGRAEFRVRARTQNEFRVRVSTATIAVIGTRFSVEERDGRGSVSVTEGVVEVRWNDGERERLGAGETAVWPKTTKEPVADVPDTDVPDYADVPDAEPAARKPDVRTIMERLFQLRSQRRYDEAVRMLRQASRRRDLSRAQRERLSYEAGNVLRQAGQNDEACAHFRKHLKRFPDSGQREDALSTCAPGPSEGN